MIIRRDLSAAAGVMGLHMFAAIVCLTSVPNRPRSVEVKAATASIVAYPQIERSVPNLHKLQAGPALPPPKNAAVTVVEEPAEVRHLVASTLDKVESDSSMTDRAKLVSKEVSTSSGRSLGTGAMSADSTIQRESSLGRAIARAHIQREPVIIEEFERAVVSVRRW